MGNDPREVTAPDGSVRWVSKSGASYETKGEAEADAPFWPRSAGRKSDPDKEFRDKFFEETFSPPILDLPWWDARAVRLQNAIVQRDALTEQDTPSVTGAQVRRAILHTRHDMVLLWVSLSSANAQLRTIRRLLVAVVIILGLIAVTSCVRLLQP